MSDLQPLREQVFFDSWSERFHVYEVIRAVIRNPARAREFHGAGWPVMASTFQQEMENLNCSVQDLTSLQLRLVHEEFLLAGCSAIEVELVDDSRSARDAGSQSGCQPCVRLTGDCDSFAILEDAQQVVRRVYGPDVPVDVGSVRVRTPPDPRV